MSQQNKGRKTMKKIYIPVAVMLGLLVPMTAGAEEAQLGGELELTPKVVDINGSMAKFQEYRDREDGVYGNLRLWQETENFFFRFDGENISYDDQSYRLKGGNHGKYKFNLYHDEIPHNSTFDARTPLSGAGTDRLVYSGATPLDNPDPADWNTFDYQIKREKQGGGLRFDLLKPFYLDVSFNHENRDGIKPAGTSWNLVSGGGDRRVLEMPEPVDYVTDTLSTEVGYALDPFYAALSYYYSTFNNNNEWLHYMHPNSGNVEGFSLAPDNDYYKFNFKGKAKLPLRSALSLGASRGVTEGETVLRNQYLSDIGAPMAVNYSDPVFDGKLVTTNYDMVLTSRPLNFVNARLFYKYYEKENRSDEIVIDSTYHNHLFGYEKRSYGAEVGFRLPQRVTLTPSYKYVKTERDRGDLTETRDKIYGVKAKWTGLDFLTLSASYERLDREADWQLLTAVIPGDQATADGIEPFVRRFDAAPQDRDTYRVTLDLYPMDNLSVVLGYRYMESEYTDTILGLRDEENSMYDIAADYTLGRLTLAGYFAYDITEAYQYQRRLVGFLFDPDPSLGAIGSSYNWSVEDEYENYDFGVSAQVEVVPGRLQLKAQYDHVRSDGTGDMTIYDDGSLPAGYDNSTIDFENWDDYKKKTLQIKAIYTVNPKLSTTVGYAYERYRYSDATLDDYDYRVASDDYLSGAYADSSYEANVVFATMKYSF